LLRLFYFFYYIPMPHSLIWLADVLKSAGLKIAQVPGWEDRGRGDTTEIFGVICHYTAGSRNGNMPSLNTLINGRAAGPGVTALQGPLAQLGLGRDGTYYLIAAGRANHAGAGIWQGLTNGNSNFIGIEAENTGGQNDFPWPQVQLDAYHRGVAAILKHVGQGAEFCAGHKEYALPKGRKSDPDLDMNAFRSSVAAIMNSTAPPVLIPAAEPPQAGGAQGRSTLRRGARGDLVIQLQTILHLSPDGVFGAATEATLRAFQRNHDIVPDGIAGPKTWKVLDTVAQ